MSLRDLDQRQLRLIGMRAGRNAIRGGSGVVFVYLIFLCGLFIANLVVSPVEAFRAGAVRGGPGQGHGFVMREEEALGEMSRFIRSAMEWVLAWDAPPEGHAGHETSERDVREWAEHLIDERPMLLSVIFVVLLFSLPFIVASGAFNQTSGDIGTRGIRFLLLRTERANLFFGRFLGSVIFTLSCLTLLLAMIVLYIGLKLDLYSWTELGSWGLRGLVALSVAAVPYVALCAAISGAIDSPFGSLLLCHGAIGAVPLFAVVGKVGWYPLVVINWLLPWGVQNDLLHPDAGRWLPAVTYCALYTLVFLGAGYWRFSRRDL